MVEITFDEVVGIRFVEDGDRVDRNDDSEKVEDCD